MSDLKSTKALVQSILEKNERARNSDYYLYYRVIKTIADKYNLDLALVSVTDFLLNTELSALFPPFETVRRARQKAQEQFPHLAACEKVSEYRAENEETFRRFARGC